MTPFRFDHIAISVADLDRQCRFYTEALGLHEEGRLDRTDVPIRTVLLTAPDGLRLELVQRPGSTPHQLTDFYGAASDQGYFHWGLAVEHLDIACDRLTQAGASVLAPPANATRPGIRFAYLKDPEGNLLELIEYT